MKNFLPETKEEADALFKAIDLSNLGVVAPHKYKIINSYDMDWLCYTIDKGVPLKYATFWKADEGCENNMLSQWYKGDPIPINGRKYVTAEQYMMSEKALLFNDIDSYIKIMNEPDPQRCKRLGRGVKNFDATVWNEAFKEIIFHGNLGKLQSDINIVYALLETENAVIIEASPLDDIYGAGMAKDDLLNSDGSLKIHPNQWHKEGSKNRAQNNLGFILMGLRDLFRQLMGFIYTPEMKKEHVIGEYTEED